ncbi:hypothetical protein STEG23_020757, partial [Scotinomys teguina]
HQYIENGECQQVPPERDVSHGSPASRAASSTLLLEILPGLSASGCGFAPSIEDFEDTGERKRNFLWLGTASYSEKKADKAEHTERPMESLPGAKIAAISRKYYFTADFLELWLLQSFVHSSVTFPEP